MTYHSFNAKMLFHILNNLEICSFDSFLKKLKVFHKPIIILVGITGKLKSKFYVY
jgi:hypothetical protein